MISFGVIFDAIKSSQNVILSGHIMPDGDSLGSMLALGIVLKNLGKDVTMVSYDPVPGNLTFLPGVQGVITGELGLKKNYDTFIMVDCSAPDRLGPYQELLKGSMTTINIDHHPGNKIAAGINYVDVEAAATGEIIYDMFLQLNIKICPDVAICLYTAIITDTGSFRYENTRPSTHRRVAHLMECGIAPAKLNELIYDQRSWPSLMLLRDVLHSMKFSSCGKVAWVSVFRHDLKKANASDEHTEGIINYPRSIKGVKVAIIFRELEAGVFKVGFRSKGKVDVNQLASRLGGGGHIKAAGCIVRGDFRTVSLKVVDMAIDAVRKINDSGYDDDERCN